MRALLIAMAFCTSASDEYIDGNKLLEKMQGSTGDQMFALGYVAAYMDAAYKLVVCQPANVTIGQINDMVRNYLINTPAERHHSADAIVMKVGSTIWPCKEQRRGTIL